MNLFGQPWGWRGHAQCRNACEFAGSLLGQAAIHVEHAASILSGPRNCAGDDFRPNWKEAVFKAGDHSEVAAAAAESPKQVAVFVFACAQHASVGGDYVRRQNVVRSPAKAPREIAEAAA